MIFHTPTSLYQVKEKVQPEFSYQHEMNGFPSFYQLVRSMVYRWVALSMLYGTDPLDTDKKDFGDEGYVFDLQDESSIYCGSGIKTDDSLKQGVIFFLLSMKFCVS